MATKVTAKKWGNSIGAIFPKELIQEKDIKENDKIFIEIIKEADLNKIFGTLKTQKRKISGQAFKDMVRKGWES